MTKIQGEIGGFTPFYLAALHGHFNVCQLFIEHGVDATKTKIDTGDTALHLSAEKGHYSICHLIVESTKKIKVPIAPPPPSSTVPFPLKSPLLLPLNKYPMNDWKQVPLHLAAKYGHLDICKLLLENSVYKEKLLADWNGKTPLDYAKMMNHYEVQKYLKSIIDHELGNNPKI